MSVKFSLLFGGLLLAVATNAVSTEFDYNEEGLGALLGASKHTFVIFHGQDCPYCDYLRGAMEKIAEETKNLRIDVRLALVNVDANPNIRKTHNIHDFPVGKLFAGATYFNFFIHRISKEQIQFFIQETLGTEPTATEIASDKAFVRLNNLDYALVFALPDIGEKERIFAQAVQSLFPKVPVFLTATGSKWDHLLFSKKSEDKKIRMLFRRDFDEGDKSFMRKDMFDPEDLAATIQRLKDPRVALITNQLSNDVFSGIRPGLVLFDHDINSNRVEILTKALLDTPFAGLAMKTNGTQAEAEAFMNHLGVSKDHFPALRILGFGGGRLSKFRYDGDWSQKDLSAFLKQFRESNLPTYIKNAPKATPSASKVHVWNRDQYMEALADTENVSVVAFVGKFCTKCHGIKEILEKTREDVRVRKAFVFATVDLDLNEVDGVEITQVPMVQVLVGGAASVFKGGLEATQLVAHLNGIKTDEL